MQIKKNPASGGESSANTSDFDIFLFMAVVKEVIVYVVHESALAHLGAASAAMEAFLATRAGFLRAVHRDAGPSTFHGHCRVE